MVTLKIKVENGFFTEVINGKADFISPTRIDGNDWHCFHQNGSIICTSKQKYPDGMHVKKFIIDCNCFTRLTLKQPGKTEKLLKSGHVLQEGLNGVLGLSAGSVDEKYAYFRGDEFQQFLDIHKITSVRNINPNKIYIIKNSNLLKTKLKTDGTYTIVDTNKRITLQGIKETEEYIDVSGATWVIEEKTVYSHNHKNQNPKVLYTLEKYIQNLDIN